jgi:hypothetical protein
LDAIVVFVIVLGFLSGARELERLSELAALSV